MADTYLYGPWWNRLLNMLLMASVGALFCGTLGAVLTIFVYCLGLIPAAFCGGFFGAVVTRRLPLRESVVLFVGCAVTSGLIIWRGNLGGWGFLWIVPSVGLGGPVAGLLLQTAARSHGPAHSRRTAQILGSSFVLALIGLIGWWIYRPID